MAINDETAETAVEEKTTVEDEAPSTAYHFAQLQKALQADEDYAWSWHCNLAMAAVDEGVDHKVANMAASRFMQMCFGIDTSSFEHFKDLFPDENKGES